MEKKIVETNENICIEKIKKSGGDETLNKLCYIKEDSIILNYIYFKYFAKKENYNCILNYIAKNIDNILLDNEFTNLQDLHDLHDDNESSEIVGNNLKQIIESELNTSINI